MAAGEVDTTENDLQTSLTNRLETMIKIIKSTSTFDNIVLVG